MCYLKIRSKPPIINGLCSFYLHDAQEAVTSSQMSPDCQLLSCTNENSSIYLYDLSTGTKSSSGNHHHHYHPNDKQVNYYQELSGGHCGAVFKSKFTHDSKHLLSCGYDGLACLWDVQSSSVVCSYTYSGHLYPVWDVELFSRLNLFLTGSKDGTARLWSFDRIYPLRVYCGHQSDVNCVQFHPNGLYMATGSSDKTVRLWSVQTCEFVRLFSGHRSRIFSLAFSPDGNYLASAGEDKKIKVWDIRSGAVFKEYKGHQDMVHSLTFDTRSEIVCSGGLDGTVKFWDLHGTADLSERTPPTTTTAKQLNSSSGKHVNGVFHSNELIASVNVNFGVHSVMTDVQNIFYASGCRKNEPKNSITDIVNNHKITVAQVQTNSNNSHGSTSVKTKAEPKVTGGHQPVSKSKANNTTPNKKTETKVEPTAATSKPSPMLSATKNTMTTRRRAAANNPKSDESTTTTQAATASNNFNFFLNDDDLYQV